MPRSYAQDSETDIYETMASGKTLRSDDIATAVLRSQPPNPDDVPNMVDSVMKWGGGEEMYFVTSIATRRAKTQWH